MKTLNRKNISMALLVTLGAIFSVNASAAETNMLEESISEMVLAQGEQVMNDLASQLQKSISDEVNRFAVDFSFEEKLSESMAWLEDEKTAPLADIKQSKPLENNHIENESL